MEDLSATRVYLLTRIELLQRSIHRSYRTIEEDSKEIGLVNKLLADVTPIPQAVVLGVARPTQSPGPHPTHYRSTGPQDSTNTETFPQLAEGNVRSLAPKKSFFMGTRQS